MTDQETKAQPAVAELEAKVQRLTTQVANDGRSAESANAAFAKAVKSGNVDQALELADARGKAQSALAKTQAQVKTATNAVASAKHALNADKIASIHDAIRDSREVGGYFQALEEFGVTRVVVERSEETGKLLVLSAGPKAPKRSGGGGGGNGRGQSVTVDGEVFASASEALRKYFPEHTSGENRARIVSMLTNAGHEVS